MAYEITLFNEGDLGANASNVHLYLNSGGELIIWYHNTSDAAAERPSVLLGVGTTRALIARLAGELGMRAADESVCLKCGAEKVELL